MRCLIVDDDPLICDLLEHFCSKVDLITEVTISNSGFESVNLIDGGNFDLVLLDYDLPDITGRQILSLINKETAVIMITSNKDFGHESYDYDQVVDYLLKPIEFPRFFKGIQKTSQKMSDRPNQNGQIFLKEGNAIRKVKLNQILFIKSAGNYLEFVFEDKKILTIMTMKEMENKLPSNFQRIHRSYIVNIERIDQILNGEVEIENHVIPISSTFENQLIQKINLLS
ncbi:LytR/AlgR family response regulator transcription factor [Maribacter sp. HTCC2170]|uniref:LytR/AlgR family response regulator transcription factor n=1 Tax=Maribacter sp. (strain HTCC2170 / KCCM 42371) TaxID=313603 RepID=UPI00006BD1F5|nr:LytTR family DNA-binding domain-containing protein [Maribacter sp. HTCC2170]EAR02444.1 two-component system response regulator [Maribacter sp. HTCC2170]